MPISVLKPLRCFKTLLQKKSTLVTASTHAPLGHIIPRQDHGVSRQDISEQALKVLYRLKKSGYQAYLVGGGVRDLLLNKHPKDFDVVTNATPEEIAQLFHSCRLIGRRFRLAHIYFGRDFVEVATFRKRMLATDVQKSVTGMILRDNEFGNIEEDAFRRDFTVNALYYNIDGFSLVDYCGGYQDLLARKIRMIGDPKARYLEDPVRMLRAIRFAVKLDFEIEPSTAAPIQELAPLLAHISHARLFEEVQKLFFSGQALKTFEMLQQYQLFEVLFPATAAAFQQPEQGSLFLSFVKQSLGNTDLRLNEGKRVTPAFLFAVFLWQPFQDTLSRVKEKGLLRYHIAAEKVIDAQNKRVALQRRFILMIREMWDLQFHLERRNPVRVEGILAHPRFRAAYDFLLLRSEFEPALQPIAQWWTDFQIADEPTKAELTKILKPPVKRRKPKPKAPKEVSSSE